jgi:hypothetical protein
VASVSVKGSELTSTSIQRRSQDRRIDWHYIEPRKPQQSAFAESLIGRLRDECVNGMPFSSLAHAREALTGWSDDRNKSAHTVPSAICRPSRMQTAFPRCNGEDRCPPQKAPPLLHRAPTAQMQPELFSSPDERRVPRQHLWPAGRCLKEGGRMVIMFIALGSRGRAKGGLPCQLGVFRLGTGPTRTSPG